MCQYYFDPGKRRVVEGLGLLLNTCVLPHHNTFGKGWAQQLAALLPGVVLLGIDERTGMLDDGESGRKIGWRVYGQGEITLYRDGKPTIYPSPARNVLPLRSLPAVLVPTIVARLFSSAKAASISPALAVCSFTRMTTRPWSRCGPRPALKHRERQRGCALRYGGPLLHYRA